MINMKLNRPLIILDLETTGTSVATDRIVQLGAIKIYPDGQQEKKKVLINPTIPIPEEATAIHGITTNSVLEAPTFRQLASAIKVFFMDCDIGGYNSDEFDIPMLIMEFHRCNIEFPDWELNFVDIYKIEKKVNSQKLESTYKRYTKKELPEAHDALVDAEAALVVLNKQLEVHGIPDTCKGLEEFITEDKKRYDYAGKTYIKDGVVYWSIGKCKDQPVLEDRSYLNWALNANFPLQTQRKLKELLQHASAPENGQTI